MIVNTVIAGPWPAIPYADLEELWRRRGVPLREKTLWRMLYETAARTSEVLALDVGDLDRARRRARIPRLRAASTITVRVTTVRA